MGLQCSLLGHTFEDAGVEREREEQGSEVITTEREIERCRRCGTERVVSESTEVAAVVDASDVGLEAESGSESDGREREAGADSNGSDADSGIASAVERSGVGAAEGKADPDEGGIDATPPGTAASDEFGTDGPTASSTAPDPNADADVGENTDSGGPPDPDAEDAEILTDDGDGGEDVDPAERKPGEWPGGAGGTNADTSANADAADSVGAEGPAETPPPGEESLSGITVPEGAIACPDCSFRVEADSGYRAGDPCPDCGAWLEAERNQ